MKAILVTGGRGQRMQSGLSLPKHLLPICGRPLLDWTLDTLQFSRVITEVTVIVGHHAPQIVSQVSKLSSRASIPVSFHEDKVLPGCWWPSVLGILRNEVEPVLIWVGDTFACFDLDRFLYDAQEFPSSLTVASFPGAPVGSTRGIVSIDEEGLVVGYEERTVLAGDLMSAGLYVTNGPLLFRDGVPPVHPERNLFPALIEQRTLRAWNAKGLAVNVNTNEDRLAAENAVSHAMPSRRPSIAAQPSVRPEAPETSIHTSG